MAAEEVASRPVYTITDSGSQADQLAVLDGIVRDVVNVLDYVGALVAPYEQGDVLPIRAVYVDQRIATMEQIREWENQINAFLPGSPISLSNPEIARVYVYDEKYKHNLSVKAVAAGKPVLSDELFDLFTPIAPNFSWPFIRGIQQGLGIRQVIAVPFFLDTIFHGQRVRECVGNLFAVSRHEFTQQEILILTTFAHQVAAAILSERRHLHVEITQKLTLEMQRNLGNQEKILESLARGIVAEMGYAAAMVATYDESGEALAARAIHVDPKLASEAQLAAWNEQIQQLSTPEAPLSLTDPDVARVLVKAEDSQNNLGVRAAKARMPITSPEIFDLLTPLAPAGSRETIAAIQRRLGIKQVIAVPFFLENQYLGNLFAATQSAKFASWEIEILRTFGRQAAAGLRNANLYRQAEDRRAAAEILGKMAFSASASIHTMRNHIGVVRSNLQLLNRLDMLANDENQRRILLQKLAPPVTERLNELAALLEQLHSPWALTTQKPVDVNLCLRHALSKALSPSDEWVHVALADELPCARASQEILTEVFRNVIKNAVEALAEKGGRRKEWNLHIESQAVDSAIQITVRDNGIGIRPENMGKIFDIRWTTKPGAVGLGLFWTKDYIEGLGGKMELESVWKEGTTCTITIPHGDVECQ